MRKNRIKIFLVFVLSFTLCFGSNMYCFTSFAEDTTTEVEEVTSVPQPEVEEETSIPQPKVEDTPKPEPQEEKTKKEVNNLNANLSKSLGGHNTNGNADFEEPNEDEPRSPIPNYPNSGGNTGFVDPNAPSDEIDVVDNTEKVTVYITGKKWTATFDGNAHEAKGYDVDIFGSPSYMESYFTFNPGGDTTMSGGIPVAQGTNAGTYYMNLLPYKFVNTNPAYDVTFIVEDGYLHITPATATIYVNNASKEFGAADPIFTADVQGLIGTDTISYELNRPSAGRDEAVGVYKNAISAVYNSSQGNYIVEHRPGDFEIVPSAQLRLETTSYSGVYDGKKHFGTVTCNMPDALIKYSIDRGMSWSIEPPSIKNVGEVNVEVKASHDDFPTVQSSYTLKVIPRGLLILSHRATKEYDGTPLSLPAIVEGLVEGESITVVNNTITNVGRTPNQHHITWDNADKSNYATMEYVGMLEVTQNSKAVNLYAPTTVREYNGKPLTDNNVTVENLPNTLTVKVTMSEASTVTNAGETVSNDIASFNIYDSDGKDVTEYFEKVIINSGELSVIPRKINVNIKGNTKTETFDGSEKVVSGFTINSEDELYDTKNISYSDKSEVRGTNAGKYMMNLDTTKFTNTDSNFDVTFNVEDGWLDVKSAVIVPDDINNTIDDENPIVPSNDNVDTSKKSSKIVPTGDSINWLPVELFLEALICLVIMLTYRRKTKF